MNRLDQIGEIDDTKVYTHGVYSAKTDNYYIFHRCTDGFYRVPRPITLNQTMNAGYYAPFTGRNVAWYVDWPAMIRKYGEEEC